MPIVEFVPRSDQLCWTFGGIAPVMMVDPGTTMKVWTEDAFSGKLRHASDSFFDVVPAGQPNPQTGPFFVNGAMPGDTLAIHFHSIEPSRDWGVSASVPWFGGMTSTIRDPTLQPALPERIWIYQVDRRARSVLFEARDSDHRIALPLAPMLGTVGLAPAMREVRSSLVPDDHGGNMDTPEMRAGTTCFLGVNVEGGLFSVGDGHYRQGEGEACGSAVEGAMDVLLTVELLRHRSTPWPRLENDEWIMSVGSGRPLDSAWRVAMHDMITWVAQETGLSDGDAYQLVSQVALAPIANVVDPNYTVVVKVPKAVLSRVQPYGGWHSQARRLVDDPA